MKITAATTLAMALIASASPLSVQTSAAPSLAPRAEIMPTVGARAAAASAAPSVMPRGLRGGYMAIPVDVLRVRGEGAAAANAAASSVVPRTLNERATPSAAPPIDARAETAVPVPTTSAEAPPAMVFPPRAIATADA